MVHIKKYTLNIKINKPEHKYFFFLMKSPKIINLIVLDFYIDEQSLLSINYIDYYNDYSIVIYSTKIIGKCFDLIKISSDLTNLTFCDGKFIKFIDVNKTIETKNIVFFTNKIQYLTDEIYDILLSNYNIILLNKNNNFYITHVSDSKIDNYDIIYSKYVFLKISKNSKYMLVKNNKIYEMINLSENNKYVINIDIKDNLKNLFITNEGIIYYIYDNNVIKYSDKILINRKIDFDIDINNCITDIYEYNNESYIIFFLPKRYIYYILTLINNNIYINELNIGKNNSKFNKIYISNYIYYFIYNNSIEIVNINNYILFCILTTLLEKCKRSIKITNLDNMKDNMKDNIFDLIPIVNNRKYSDKNMKYFIDFMMNNYNIMQILSYEVSTIKTNNIIINNVIDCLIKFKLTINDETINNYVELLLILFLCCYYLEYPTEKNIIELYKKSNNKSNVSCPDYPDGIFEKIYSVIHYNKNIFVDTIENALFY